MKVNAMSYAKMLKEIELRGKNVDEVAAATGLSTFAVRGYLKALLKERLIHITHWTTDTRGRDVTAHYMLGFGVDRPRRNKSRAQVREDYQERLRLREGRDPKTAKPKPKAKPAGILSKDETTAVRRVTLPGKGYPSYVSD